MLFPGHALSSLIIYYFGFSVSALARHSEAGVSRGFLFSSLKFSDLRAAGLGVKGAMVGIVWNGGALF